MEKNDSYRITLMLTGVRNLLEQNNPNGVNDYLLEIINRELGLK